MLGLVAPIDTVQRLTTAAPLDVARALAEHHEAWKQFRRKYPQAYPRIVDAAHYADSVPSR